MYNFEWVFRAKDDDEAARRVKEFIDKKAAWDDSDWIPFVEKDREELRLRDILCLELHRIVASLYARPRDTLLAKKGEYCLLRNITSTK